MKSEHTVSHKNQRNWWIDAGLFLSGSLATLTGIYFLFLPVGGYHGGRNPFYGITILFERHTWEDLHTWGGLAMIAIALLHLALHGSWFVQMFRRMMSGIRTRQGSMNPKARYNLILNLVVVVSFLLTAVSGIYFFLIPHGSNVLFVFDRTGWDLIHTWAGNVFIIAAVLHFAIHWRWVMRVTGSMAYALRGFFSRKTNGAAALATVEAPIQPES